MATCYRHPDRETNVRCSSCDRPICPSCMTPTSVGMRCPECAGERTQVRTAASIRGGVDRELTVTIILIVINAVAFLASGQFGLQGGSGTRVFTEGALFGPSVADGEYWRLVTGGFLHAGLLHIGLNMFLLFILGRMLEPAIGHARFLAVYLTALLAGSFGALLVTPDAVTVGASGAIFGLMGAAAIELWARGHSVMEAGIGGLILVNLGLGFFVSGISIGGHVGGLIGGGLAMLSLQAGDRMRRPWVGYALCGVVVAGCVLGAIAAAHTAGGGAFGL